MKTVKRYDNIKTPVSTIKKQSSAPIKSTGLLRAAIHGPSNPASAGMAKRNDIVKKTASSRCSSKKPASTVNSNSSARSSSIIKKHNSMPFRSQQLYKISNPSPPLPAKEVIIKVDKAENTTENDHQQLQDLTIRFRELQEQNSTTSLDLEMAKSTIITLMEQFNDKDASHKEAQNKIIALENNIKKISSDNVSIKRDHDEIFKTLSAQNSELNTQIKSLVKEAKVNDSIKTEKIEQLRKEKNKFKFDLNEASRERDEAAEKAIVLTNKLAKFSATNSKLKPEVLKHRNNRVINLLESSDKDDEIIEKNDKILLLEDIILKHKELNEHIMRENSDKENSILDLHAKIVELENELYSWETRAECKVQIIIRDKFTNMTEKLGNEIQQLKIKNQQLLNDARISDSQYNEQLEKLHLSIKKKQEMIDNQLEIINLHNFVEKNQTTDDLGDEEVEDDAQEGFVHKVLMSLSSFF